MWKNLLPANRSYIRHAWLKLSAAGALSLLLAFTASAYTLVFRNGQRMEIPAEFTLTRNTLTYEISPGFNKTLQVALLDVAATERANGQRPGSFFQQKEQPAAVTQSATGKATKTLSNIDLAGIRQRRIASEQAYEKRRLELGLPSVAESRRRQEEESAGVREWLREKARSDARDEAYWRGRARELRTEIASLDAGIHYLRARITEVNESASANRPVITEVYPLWPNDRRGRNGRWGRNRPDRPTFGPGFPYPNGYPNGGYGNPNVYGYPNGGYGNPNVYGYPNGGYGNPNVYGYPNGGYGNPNVYGYPNGGYGYPNGSPGYPSGPFDNFGNSAEQADLKGRLDEMMVKRAGLAAQWQALEDEARDARIPQVWLLP